MDTEAIASRTKDCSKGFCTLYCRQWCYIIFPPPPPPPLEDFPDDQTSGPNFSTLFITVIGILAGALLLISYYAIVTKYCRNRFLSPTTTPDQNNRDADDDDYDEELGLQVAHEPWFVATNGLDEALITSLTMFEYKRGQGLVEGTDCSVCLNEFVEDERLRLLPKCSHAFHVQCIDTWLTCHSNCPLCRANVAGPTSSPPSSLLRTGSSADEPVHSSGEGEVENSGAEETHVEYLYVREQDACETMAPKTPRREWRDDDEGNRHIRRSVSMDCVSSVKDSVCVIDDDEDGEREESSRRSTSRDGMKRSHSSGRWFVSKWGKANSVIPF